jgi:hypothetical protein
MCRYFCPVASVAAATPGRALLSFVTLAMCHGAGSTVETPGSAARATAATNSNMTTLVANDLPLLIVPTPLL